jgi:hypothetical protein
MKKDMETGDYYYADDDLNPGLSRSVIDRMRQDTDYNSQADVDESDLDTMDGISYDKNKH